MFGLFKKSTPTISVVDKVWMSHTAKMAACKEMIAIHSDTLFVVWFKETLEEFEKLFEQPLDHRKIVYAKDLTAGSMERKIVVFGEHYPLPAIEQDLFRQMGLKDIAVLSSLDEPLFTLFGGEKIIGMMRQMGMKEHEVIGHTLVSKSIANAQRKIGEKVKFENQADSQGEWFRKNIGDKKNRVILD